MQKFSKTIFIITLLAFQFFVVFTSKGQDFAFDQVEVSRIDIDSIDSRITLYADNIGAKHADEAIDSLNEMLAEADKIAVRAWPNQISDLVWLELVDIMQDLPSLRGISELRSRYNELLQIYHDDAILFTREKKNVLLLSSSNVERLSPGERHRLNVHFDILTNSYCSLPFSGGRLRFYDSGIAAGRVPMSQNTNLERNYVIIVDDEWPLRSQVMCMAPTACTSVNSPAKYAMIAVLSEHFFRLKFNSLCGGQAWFDELASRSIANLVASNVFHEEAGISDLDDWYSYYLPKRPIHDAYLLNMFSGNYSFCPYLPEEEVLYRDRHFYLWQIADQNWESLSLSVVNTIIEKIVSSKYVNSEDARKDLLSGLDASFRDPLSDLSRLSLEEGRRMGDAIAAHLVDATDQSAIVFFCQRQLEASADIGSVLMMDVCNKNLQLIGESRGKIGLEYFTRAYLVRYYVSFALLAVKEEPVADAQYVAIVENNLLPILWTGWRKELRSLRDVRNAYEFASLLIDEHSTVPLLSAYQALYLYDEGFEDEASWRFMQLLEANPIKPQPNPHNRSFDTLPNQLTEHIIGLDAE